MRIASCLEQSSSPYCVLCFYYWSLLRTFVSATWHSVLYPALESFVHISNQDIFCCTRRFLRRWVIQFLSTTLFRGSRTNALRTHGCEMEPESCLNCGIVGTKAWEAWGMSEIQRACRDLVVHYGIFFFDKRRCVSRSSGHSERVQRAVGASNVRMFLAFKGLVHLEDWGLFFFLLKSCNCLK